MTGTSSTLPDSVRGTAAIWRISLGTWRGEQSSRTRRRIVATSSSVSDCPVGEHDEQRHPAVGRRSRGQVDHQRVDDLVGTDSTAR